jgi:predicted DNA-binding transcriptional regulator AlpA
MSRQYSPPPKKYVRCRDLCARYGDVHPKTIYRRVEAGLLPEPMKINGVNHWRLDQIEAGDVERLSSPSSRGR